MAFNVVQWLFGALKYLPIRAPTIGAEKNRLRVSSDSGRRFAACGESFSAGARTRRAHRLGKKRCAPGWGRDRELRGARARSARPAPSRDVPLGSRTSTSESWTKEPELRASTQGSSCIVRRISPGQGSPRVSRPDILHCADSYCMHWPCWVDFQSGGGDISCGAYQRPPKALKASFKKKGLEKQTQTLELRTC